MGIDTQAGAAADGFLVAVGGDEGGRVDQHFGQAEAFLVYRVSGADPVLLDRRDIATHARGDEDRRATIVRMLADCRMLLVAKVGEAPKALLAAAGIEATDRFSGRPVADALAELTVPAIRAREGDET